jgi:hypothetical protein
MSGLELLLDLVDRGFRFRVEGGDARLFAVPPPGVVVSAEERILIAAIKHEVRALILTELPDDPGVDVCGELDAPAGSSVCRRCARGLGAHFWKRASLKDACTFAVGTASEPCQRCGAPAIEHYGHRGAAQ